MKVGDTVVRCVAGYTDIKGTVVEIDNTTGRARVQWSLNKTWYKINKLAPVEETPNK